MEGRTSLTGMQDTPISFAMNQDIALCGVMSVVSGEREGGVWEFE